MNGECPECGQMRDTGEAAPIYECPNCGSFYATVAVTLETLPSRDSDRAGETAVAANRSAGPPPGS